MINVNKLKGKIVEEGKTQGDVAKVLDMTPKTFGEKMKKGIFGSDEIEVMIEFLHIQDPMEVFFPDFVA